MVTFTARYVAGTDDRPAPFRYLQNAIFGYPGWLSSCRTAKTGTRIAIPLALRCDKLNLTLDDVVSSCRDCVLSPWLLHHHHAKGTAKRGGMVKPATLTVAFKKPGILWITTGVLMAPHPLSMSRDLYQSDCSESRGLIPKFC